MSAGSIWWSIRATRSAIPSASAAPASSGRALRRSTANAVLLARFVGLGRALAFLSSKIRGDALVLPIAVACRFGALRTLDLLLRRLGVGRGQLPPLLGFGKRALRSRGERLAPAGR